MKAAPGQGGASQGVSLPEAWRLVQRDAEVTGPDHQGVRDMGAERL